MSAKNMLSPVKKLDTFYSGKKSGKAVINDVKYRYYRIRIEYGGMRIGRKFEIEDGSKCVNLIVDRFCDSAYLNGKAAGSYEE